VHVSDRIVFLIGNVLVNNVLVNVSEGYGLRGVPGYRVTVAGVRMKILVYRYCGHY
jgi:hypothetical protein